MTKSLYEALKTRRSVKPKEMAGPGPSPEQIDEILSIAARVPDHGKYAPWYFIVFSGDARATAGEKFAELFLKDHPEASEAQLEAERQRFQQAPLVVGVVSRIREGKNPQWEQLLSAGAVCYNLCLAANALGFASNWLTQWVSFDARVKSYLGIPPEDNIAGFIHIGTAASTPEDRERPDMARIVTRWQPGKPLNTGEGYGQPGSGYPETAFTSR